MEEQFVSIGFVKKPHGVKGEVKVSIEEKFTEGFLQAPAVFLKIKGKPVPHFIEEIRPGNQLLVKFEHVATLAQAQELSAREILLDKRHLHPDTLRAEESDGSPFSKYTGYELIDTERGAIGAIAEVLKLPGQEVALVKRGEREIMVPLHPRLVEKTDTKERKLYVVLPEGLLDL